MITEVNEVILADSYRLPTMKLAGVLAGVKDRKRDGKGKSYWEFMGEKDEIAEEGKTRCTCK